MQGGFDYAHSSGFYAGHLGVERQLAAGLRRRTTAARVEWDFYGGYKANFGNSDFFWDVGTIYYYYPGKRNPGVVNADTWEVYGALGWKWVSVKLSYSLDDYFGARPNANADRPTARSTSTSRRTTRSATPASRSSATSATSTWTTTATTAMRDFGKVGYTDWKLGVAYTVPDGP